MEQGHSLGSVYGEISIVVSAKKYSKEAFCVLISIKTEWQGW